MTYKIKRDELFSTGGQRPSWARIGKTWNTLGSLKLHLNQVRTADYADARIVRFEMKETESFPVTDLARELQERKERIRQDGLRVAERAHEDRARESLRDITKKYPHLLEEVKS